MELLAEHGMTTLRVALAQINATVGDLDGNVRKVVDYVGRARDLGADVVALPELAITGYPPEDLVFRPQFVAANRQALDDVIAESHGITVIVGFVDSEPNSGPNPGQGRIYNAAAVASDGELVSVYRKQLLPNYGVFDERRYFTPGDSTQVYCIGGSPMAVNICEDIWFSHGPTGAQAIQGARLIVNINGSPYHRGKRVQREGMLAERARENGVAIAYVNMVGGQDELVFDGGSVFVSPTGDVTTRARQFEEELLVCDVPIAQMAPNPDSDLGTGTGTGTTEGFIAISGARPKPRPSLPATQDPDPMSDLEEVYTALVTGTGDYVRKTGFDKVVLALSGGIDSTLVTVIATDALGPENVVVVSMPSRYSSQGSVTDADALARNLGVEMLSTPIEPVFAAYLSTLESAFAGTEPDVAEENLQSRIRGDLVMALSNKFGYLALTTGNKSEYATGYATLYGDMSGGFAVIKDVPKTLVYDLCRYRNTVSPVIPVSVIIKPPSAELRPDQLDEDSLPPYEVLDPIAKAYVEDDLSYGQIVELGYAPETVQRVISLIDRAEYKRRQAAPGVKITERNFGRDRRMPIINRYRPF
jgi:NAD+ synthase (glutamine-hydrolysing)